MAIRPVTGKLTQEFGVRNSAYRMGFHAGSDYQASVGTPILATTNGRVVHYGGYNGGYGNVAALILPNGDVVWHAHLSRFGAGGNVGKGTIIGYTGATGYTFGPHLHVEYRLGGNQNRPTNFETWLANNPEPRPTQPTQKTLYLPKTAPTWRVYPLNKAPVVGNEVGYLLPSKYGGLQYTVLAMPQANVATIQTQAFGKVNIWVAPDTGAVIK